MTIFKAIEENNIVAIKQWMLTTAINHKDEHGRTPVMLATYQNKPTLVDMFIQAGADVNIQDNQLNNPYLYASKEGYMTILKLVLAAKTNTKIYNRYGDTALIPAAEHDYLDVMTLLLRDTDIDINHMNDLGWTALLKAIILGDGSKTQQQVVRMLLQYEADFTIADKEGVTPLQHARQKNYIEIANILQEAGASY